MATQSYANLAYRPQGLALLRTGVDAAGVVAGLTAADEGRAQRQVGVVGHDRRRGHLHRRRLPRLGRRCGR